MADETFDTTGQELVGVCLALCDGDGNLTKVWLKIGSGANSVQALQWGTSTIPAKPPAGNPKATLPTTSEPTKCTPGAVATTPICWWNGNQWVCD